MNTHNWSILLFVHAVNINAVTFICVLKFVTIDETFVFLMRLNDVFSVCVTRLNGILVSVLSHVLLSAIVQPFSRFLSVLAIICLHRFVVWINAWTWRQVEFVTIVEVLCCCKEKYRCVVEKIMILNRRLFSFVEF